MNETHLQGRDPEELEREIAYTRESLHRNLEELHDRLSPRTRLHRLREHVSRVPRETYFAWTALGAVATGTYLAVTGWRRTGSHFEAEDEWLVDVAVPCSPAPPL